jgi:hypothetical protein
MPTLPETYTEATLTQFMIGVLKETGVMLNWTVQAQYQDAIDMTVEALGVTDITQATGGSKIRSLGRMMVWKTVLDATAGMYDFSADGGSFSRSQINRQAREQYKESKVAAKPYLVTNRVAATGISIPNEAVY